VVPEEMKRRWTGFQVNRARSWRPALNAEPFIQHQENLIQAYRLYTLALAGTPETGVMNRFREEIAGSADARWRLAAAYLLIGQSAAANQLISLMPDQKTIYENEGPTYGTPLRDKALILETLLLKNDRKAAFKVVSEMAQEIGNSNWLSTQTAAWSFYAIARYFSNETAGQGIRAVVTLNGKKENVTSAMAVVKMPLSLNGSSSVKATVVNNGTGILYARLVSRGIPLEDHAPEIQRNLRMETLFTDRNGQPLNPASLPQGSDLFLQVSVSHPGIKGKYKNLALTTIMPSGWEILNSRVQDIPGAGQGNFDYQDIRDDRVYTYFELRPAETKKFRFALHAAYSGKYILPATVVEGMYDNELYARIPGRWVSVK